MQKRKTFNAIFFVLVILTAVEPYSAKRHVLVTTEGPPKDFFMARTVVSRWAVPVTIPDLTDLSVCVTRPRTLPFLGVRVRH